MRATVSVSFALFYGRSFTRTLRMQGADQSDVEL